MLPPAGGLATHLDHPAGQPLSKRDNVCQADPLPEVGDLGAEVGLLLLLPPALCAVLHGQPGLGLHAMVLEVGLLGVPLVAGVDVLSMNYNRTG